MKRRRFLRAATGVAGLGLAGCSGSGATGDDDRTTTGTSSGAGTDAGRDTGETATDDGTTTTGRGVPDGVYVQSFVENMLMAGAATAGDYRFAVTYTFPHEFWTVTGTEREVVPKRDGDSVHLMATVWDPETGTVLPETGLSVEILREDDLVTQEVIYPMLSQRMGFHYGGNFGLGPDGTYTARVSVGGTDVRRTGSFAGRFGDPETIEIGFEFTEKTRGQFTSEESPKARQRGAIKPMNVEMQPVGRAPAAGAMPGTVIGSGLSDDARFVVSHTDAERLTGDHTRYVAVSARTRYNGLILPAMALSATVRAGGETVHEGPLVRALDPELGYHYGVRVDAETVDGVTVSVDTPPQVARHEGYETAFLEMDDARIGGR